MEPNVGSEAEVDATLAPPIPSQGCSLFPFWLPKERPRNRHHVAPAGGQEGDVDRHQADGLARARRRAQAVGRAPRLELLPSECRSKPLVSSVFVSFPLGCRSARSRVGGRGAPRRLLHADHVASCFPRHQSSTEDGSSRKVNSHPFAPPPAQLAIGICIMSGTLESDVVSRVGAIVGAVVGVLGFILVVFGWPKKRGHRLGVTVEPAMSSSASSAIGRRWFPRSVQGRLAGVLREDSPVRVACGGVCVSLIKDAEGDRSTQQPGLRS